MMSNLPNMSRAEEAEFWKTHDAIDFLDDLEPVTIDRGSRPEHRCTRCDKILLSRYVDFEVASGQAVLRDSRELYCPDSHETYLSPEAQRLVEAIEAVLRLAPQISLRQFESVEV